jgi:diguanylate cyclase (GGDEF)-like protein
MVSLRRYLAGSEESLTSRRALDILIRGIVESAVSIDAAEHKLFSESVARMAAAVQPGCDADDLLVLSCSVIQTLQDYNTRTASLLKRQGAEFQNMMGMLAHAVMTISGGTGKSVESLNELRHGLESAALLEDIRKVKSSLAECLRSVCDEVQRRKSEAEGLVAQLQAQIDRGQNSRYISDEDVATGLPRRKTAQEAINQAVLIPGKKFLLTAVLDRLQSLNARFGQEVGDRVLRALAERLKESLGDSDVLYRWTGPAIVALLWRDENIEQVRRSVRHIFDTPFEKELDIGGRQILIPVSAAWSVIGLIPPAANSFNYVDRFVASQSPRDYC